MKLVLVSLDRKIFVENTRVREKMIEYGELFDHIDVIVFSKKSDNFNKQDISSKVTIHPTNSKNKWHYINDAIDIGKNLQGINYVSGDGPETSMSAFKIAKKLKAKFQIQIHTDIFSSYFANASFLNFIRVQIVKKLLPKADSIRVVSERIKDSILSQDLNLKNEPIVLPILFSYENENLNEERPKEYENFKKVFVTISRLEPEKNISYMLDIFKEISKDDPEIGLVIVGAGSEKEKLNLANNVKLIGWTEEPWRYLKNADFYIQTSKYEGFGVSLFEAALAGLPIISTDVGLIGSVLKDEESAIVISDNLEESVSKIKSFISDPEKVQKIAENANKSALEYSVSKEEYLKKFKESFK